MAPVHPIERGINAEHADFDQAGDVAFDTWDELFERKFQHPRFTEWVSKEQSWQLRIVGPPGSGKTTFSTLVVRRLQEKFASQDVKIISVFFKRSIPDDKEVFLSKFLTSILRQLKHPRAGTDSNSAHNIDPPDIASALINNASLRKAVTEAILLLEQVFIIVDDIDVCTGSVLDGLEAELSMLQNHQSVHILVTSRVPHSFETPSALATCDANKESHRGRDAYVYWVCRECHWKGDHYERDLWIICYECKRAGKLCLVHGANEPLVVPHSYFMDDFGHPGRLDDYVSYELERDHGDLGLQSKNPNKPPHSTLGRLITESPSSQLAKRLHRRVMRGSDGNITLAKLRMNDFQIAQTFENVERVGDRIPDRILAFFDAAIERILKQKLDSDLGLYAIIGLAIQFDAHYFEELEEWLQAQGLLEHDSYEENVIRTLRAAAGWITAENTKPIVTKLAFRSFSKYVEQDYNKTLSTLKRKVERTFANSIDPEEDVVDSSKRKEQQREKESVFTSFRNIYLH